MKNVILKTTIIIPYPDTMAQYRVPISELRHILAREVSLKKLFAS